MNTKVAFGPNPSPTALQVILEPKDAAMDIENHVRPPEQSLQSMRSSDCVDVRDVTMIDSGTNIAQGSVLPGSQATQSPSIV